MSWNNTHSNLYSIQHYVTKVVNDLKAGLWFSQVLQFPPPLKLSATI